MGQNLPASILELATRRKTTRVFTRDPVSLEDVLCCIRVAVQAPSGANKQPWRFIIIDDSETREKVRALCEEQERRFHESVEAELRQWFRSKSISWRKPFLTEAPILLAVLSDQRMPYATESTWLAIGYVLLALEERSLSTLTYTPSFPENIRVLFNAPEDYKLEAILPVGRSGDSKPKETRRPLESCIYRNVWGAIWI